MGFGTNHHVVHVGRLAASPALSLVLASPLVKTSSIHQRIQHSAQMLVMAVVVATLPGIGSKTQVWQLVVITQTLALVILAIHTAWLLVHITCLPQQNIP